jgi:sugar phosphate isomerase/epimerase
MNDWRIGVSTASFYPNYLTEEALTTAAALGFPVFEVFLQADAEYTPAFGEELDRRRRASGVEIHSLHLYATLFDLWSPYPRLRKEVRERFLRLLEVAARVEARALTWHGLRYGVDNPRLIDAFFESLVWATERAVKAGLTLCVENVSWCYLRHPEQVEDLQSLELPIGFTFDSFQAAESGTDSVALIEAMGSQLTTVHLADYAPAGPRHLPPGEGLVEWERVLAGLESVGYTGPLIIEVAQLERPEALPAMRDFLRTKIVGRHA